MPRGMAYTERQIRDFWAKVDRSNPDGCWEWQGAKTHRGYGVKRNHVAELGGKHNIHVHRMSWEMANGPIPEGMLVCHRCDNRPCVNPTHLFLGTSQDNTQDMIAKGRHSAPPRAERRFTREDAQRMAELDARGLSYRAIGKAFDTTHGMVRRVLSGIVREN